MSGLRRAAHDRARELAALRVDEPLPPADAAWLDEHLAGCAACARIAAGYAADHDLFAGLRGTQPLPPRDLWARTAAAIDAESAGSRRAAARRGRRLFGVPAASLAPAAGLAVVAVAVGTVLLNGAPVGPRPVDEGPAPTAIAMVSGEIAVVTRDADGRLHVLTAGVDEVCPLVADECTVAEPSFETTALAGIAANDSVDAILSPDRDRLVVVQRDATGANGVFVVPVTSDEVPHRSPAPAQTAEPPSAGPSESPTERSAAPSVSQPVASVSAAPATGSASPTASAASPSSSSIPSGAPASDVPSSEPPTTGSPSSEVPSIEAPSASATPSAEPSLTPSLTASPEPTPTVAVTPAPDGTIEIAKDVVVVGGVAAYSPDGSRFAFTARPADGSAGPDAFVWDTDDTRARAVTTDHRSVFAGWDRGELLVSRVVDGTPRTIAINPRTGAEQGERGTAAWLPTVSPDGTRAVWWDGSVRLAADGVTWVPDKGRLVMGTWPVAGTDPQVIERRAIVGWEVQWAPDGSVVAVFTAAGRDEEAGRLSVYGVGADGRAALDTPLLRDERVFSGFSLEEGRLAYAAPDPEGERTVWILAWEDGQVGKVELEGEGGATVVR